MIKVPSTDGYFGFAVEDVFEWQGFGMTIAAEHIHPASMSAHRPGEGQFLNLEISFNFRHAIQAFRFP